MKGENIFENAYFGKLYKTRDGRKAIYIGDNTCWIEGNEHETGYGRNGMFIDNESDIDIISEWTNDIEINNTNKKKLSIDDFPGLRLIKEELLSKGYKPIK